MVATNWKFTGELQMVFQTKSNFTRFLLSVTFPKCFLVSYFIVFELSLEINYTHVSGGLFRTYLQVLPNKRLKFKYRMIKEFIFPMELSSPKRTKIVTTASLLRMP